jgi:hypothetical protein
MFARGVLSPHTAQLPVPKTLATNSRISITSKLIQTKRLQVLYSGHLRKTGGRGSYQLCHEISGWLLPLPSANLSALRASALAFLFSCPELSAVGCWLATVSFRNPFVSPAYAKTGGSTRRKCRRADIFSLFSPNPHSRISFLSIACARDIRRRMSPLSLSKGSSLPPTLLLPHSRDTNASNGPCLSLRNLFSAFRLSVLCVSAVSPSSLYSPLARPP